MFETAQNSRLFPPLLLSEEILPQVCTGQVNEGDTQSKGTNTTPNPPLPDIFHRDRGREMLASADLHSGNPSG